MSHLQKGQVILLMREDNHPLAPDQAVAAYCEETRCGYVCSPDVPLVRALIGEQDGIGVRLEQVDVENDSFWVSMEAEGDWIAPDYVPVLDLQPIANIALPSLNRSHELVVDQLQRCSQTLMQTDADELSRSLDTFLYSLQKMLPVYGTSLSGDDYRAAVSALCTISHFQELMGEDFDLLEDERLSLSNTYAHMARTEQDCLKVWQKEYRQAQKTLKAKGGLLNELDLMWQNLPTLRQELLAHLLDWLNRLPHNLYPLLGKKPSLFAARLYYERFSTAELDAIKTYLIVYDHLRNWDSKVEQSDWGRFIFPDRLANHERGRVAIEMRAFTAKPYTVPTLVKKVQGLVVRQLLRSPNEGNFSQYCRALKAYFNLQFDDANFRKAYKKG